MVDRVEVGDVKGGERMLLVKCVWCNLDPRVVFHKDASCDAGGGGRVEGVSGKPIREAMVFVEG